MPPGDDQGMPLVTLVGTGLLGATGVSFGATPAADFVVANAATIIAAVPVGTAGTVNVTVTTPGGTSNALPYEREE